MPTITPNFSGYKANADNGASASQPPMKPKFSGVQVRHTAGSNQVQFELMPNDTFKGIRYEGETKPSKLADELSPFASGASGESELSIINFHSQARHNSAAFDDAFEKLLQEAPIPKETKQQAVNILKSNSDRKLELHKNGDATPHLNNHSAPWHTVVTYQGNPAHKSEEHPQKGWFSFLFQK